MSSEEDESDGKPKAKPTKIIKTKNKTPIKPKHIKDNNQFLIETLIKQQAEAKEQSRRVEEQLLQLLKANKNISSKKSKHSEEVEETDEEESHDDTIVVDNNYINKHNIRKSKCNVSEDDNVTEEEDEEEDEDTKENDDEELEDDDDAVVIKKQSKINNKKKTMKNNKNNKYKCFIYNDYEYMIRDIDDYIEVKLPWLECGYDWNALLPEHQDGSNKKKKRKK